MSLLTGYLPIPTTLNGTMTHQDRSNFNILIIITVCVVFGAALLMGMSQEKSVHQQFMDKGYSAEEARQLETLHYQLHPGDR